MAVAAGSAASLQRPGWGFPPGADSAQQPRGPDQKPLARDSAAQDAGVDLAIRIPSQSM